MKWDHLTWEQRWSDVLFLHYAVAEEDLQPLVGPHLEIDTYAGQAWISLVLFRLTLRPAGWPSVPGFSSLLELNVRTYVRYKDSPGIMFLRMYADNRLAIAAARCLTPLRYRLAQLNVNDARISRRAMSCESFKPGGKLAARFEVVSPANAAEPGSLDEWLVERYRLFVPQASVLFVAEVTHEPWKIAEVEPNDCEQSLDRELDLSFGDLLSAHYSCGVRAHFGSFERLINRSPAGEPAACV